MNTDTDMTLDFARDMATRLARKLRPACERIEVAGSIRRKDPSPNDIELVCKPEFAVDLNASPADLLVSEAPRANMVELACRELLAKGMLEKRPDKNGNHAWGEKAKRGIFYDGEDYAPCDIFSVIEPAQWGVIYAIRTGPWQFNRWLVTNERFGGACPKDLKVAGGRVWYIGESPNAYQLAGMPSNKFLGVAENNGCRWRPIETEEQFFGVLGVPHLPPEERTKSHLMEIVNG